MKSLVIVESPTKAKTIGRFLGKNYIVKSSYGHIRDLPKKKMGVDVEHDFEPEYVIPPAAKKRVTALKKAAEKVDEIILATDEDREGEAIAWHLLKAMKPKNKTIKRIVFHEITKSAIEEALENPREVDEKLVDAQQARRVLDRLVGYELSPLLWKKIMRGLSAGRVQSAAVRLIVDREEERRAFKAQEYWKLEALLHKDKTSPFSAMLAKEKGKAIKKHGITSKEKMDTILKGLVDATYTVTEIKRKSAKKYAMPPFTTSTLQQAASSRLGFSAKQTMMIAQKLYEGIDIKGEGHVGLITYMRTDSFNLAASAINQARGYISQTFGEKYTPAKPNFYTKKSKLAQEAHEAIRPTEMARTPDSLKGHLDAKQMKLYTLIWQRMIACQMAPAELDKTAIMINAGDYDFKSNGQIITFDGFLKVYPMQTKENELPEISEGDELTLNELKPTQHFTEPPARYSEAKLIKALEEHGIGRPSTYAPTISTILSRKYVDKDDNKKLYPTETGETVNKLLVKHFPNIVDLEFTAGMEEKFDEIATGGKKWKPTIKEFYDPFKKTLTEKEKTIDRKEYTEKATDEVCDKCNSPMVIKLGRFGKFLACSNYPDCKNTKPLDDEDTEENGHNHEKQDPCEKCGGEMVLKHGRYGKFWACSKYPDCKNIRSHKIKVGVKCPLCETGDVLEKKSKKGRTFYGCSNYPDCEFVSWGKPVDQKCPDCGSIMVHGAKGKIKCSSKDCKHTEALPEKSEE